MQKFMLSFEDIDIDTLPEIDDGESMLQATAQQESNAEAADLANNINRSIQITEALESIVEVIANKDEITPTEQNLIQIAGDMAVAGTDTDSSVLIPATESLDTRVSVESIGEKVKSAITSIGNALVTLWTKVSNFVKNLAFHMRTLVGKIRNLQKRVQALKNSGVKTLKDVTVKGRHNLLNADGRPIKTFSEARKIHDTAFSISNDFVDVVSKNLVIMDKDMSVLEHARDLLNIKETGTAFFNDTLEMATKVIKAAKLQKANTTNKADEYESKDSVIGRTIVVRIPSKDHFDFNEYSDLRHAGSRFGAMSTTSARFAAAYHSGIEDIKLDKVELRDIESVIDDMLMNTSELEVRLMRVWKLTENATKKIQAVLQGVAFTLLPGVLAITTDKLVQAILFSYRMANVNVDFVRGCLMAVIVPMGGHVDGTLATINDLLRKKGWE